MIKEDIYDFFITLTINDYKKYVVIGDGEKNNNDKLRKSDFRFWNNNFLTNAYHRKNVINKVIYIFIPR